MMTKRRFVLYVIDFFTLVIPFLLSRLITGYLVLLDAVESSWLSGLSWVRWGLFDMLVFSACIFGFRTLFRIYRNVLRYANSSLYLKMVMSDVLGGLTAALIIFLFRDFSQRMLVADVIATMVALMITLIGRFTYASLHVWRKSADHEQKKPVAIVGAGSVGILLAKELSINESSQYYPVCFVDVHREKVGKFVRGLKVYEENEDILRRLADMNVKDIILALPRFSGEELERIYRFYSQGGFKIKVYELPVHSVEGSEMRGKPRLRDFSIEDLLFRDSVASDMSALADFYCGKTVLVTGGGGSIGSELCRQVAQCGPKHLIIVDIYENNAYDIQQELKARYGQKLNLSVEIASVRDTARLDAIFAAYRPQIVFHAAAHKHVPLMEHSSCEVIKNNVLGTYNTANAAEKHGVERFILISTDKAVNPTNMMGASKRMCEMVVQCRTDSRTSFAAVRFGNVLGSNGSVIPLFRRQIEKGGPITLTDKRIIRYFMTIPEASQLVMQAGAMAKRGDLFVLDMGNPVRILDLAENMIRLSGLQPYRDIDIVEIGLRPGEKLYEELLIQTESLDKTENSKIFIERDAPLSRDEVDRRLSILRRAVEEGADELTSVGVREAMKQVVPTFHEPEEVNAKASEAKEMQLANT
ncbi:MAG: polysaccharide biosynthesis protein [Ruminococcaceae bacterium]|nr:polysaccharide biosynthesis protein [Oscillospiraceae bacterium]